MKNLSIQTILADEKAKVLLEKLKDNEKIKVIDGKGFKEPYGVYIKIKSCNSTLGAQKIQMQSLGHFIDCARNLIGE